MVEQLLFVAAAAFAVVNGANDGGALLSVGLTVRSIRPALGVALLSVSVAAAPLLVGTGVATTLSERLVVLDGEAGQLALLVAVVVAVGVTALLSRRGLPTSLTLALVGGIAGVGVGGRLPVSWRAVALVLVVAAVAPLVGMLAAVVLVRGAQRLPARGDLGRRIRGMHVVAFGLQCVAYGSNDGQKMLAIFAVAAGSAGAGVVPVAWQLAAIAILFGLGTVLGVRRFAGTIGSGVLAVRPSDAVATELAAASVVFGTGALGAPVSMTQALSGALVGCGLTHGYGRVRWRAAARIAMAWLLTLPTCFSAAAVAGLATSRL